METNSVNSGKNNEQAEKNTKQVDPREGLLLGIKVVKKKDFIEKLILNVINLTFLPKFIH